eukprot:4144174-Amphidinium_carterae.1
MTGRSGITASLESRGWTTITWWSSLPPSQGHQMQVRNTGARVNRCLSTWTGEQSPWGAGGTG